MKPDYQAPETANIANNANFYPSQRAIGRLFRRIDLPPLQTGVPVTRQQRRRIREGRRQSNGRGVDNLAGSLAHMQLPDDPLFEIMEDHVSKYIGIPDEPSQELRENIAQIFKRFCSEMTQILSSHTLSHSRTALLSEEEAIIGTIAQKTSQSRRRIDLMAKLR
jgi:RNA-dependent RNA polymerase